MNDVASSGRPSLSPGLAVQESSLFLLILYEPSEKKNGNWRERILGGSILDAAEDAAASWGLRIATATQQHPKASDGYLYAHPDGDDPAALRAMLESRGGPHVVEALRTPFWEKSFRYAIVKTAFFG